MHVNKYTWQHQVCSPVRDVDIPGLIDVGRYDATHASVDVDDLDLVPAEGGAVDGYEIGVGEIEVTISPVDCQP